MATESLKVGRAWDDEFQGWTAILQLGRKLKKPSKSASKPSTWTGQPMTKREPADYPSKGSKADVRARLQGIARRSRQVMVKITPGKNQTINFIRVDVIGQRLRAIKAIPGAQVQYGQWLH